MIGIQESIIEQDNYYKLLWILDTATTDHTELITNYENLPLERKHFKSVGGNIGGGGYIPSVISQRS